MARGVADTEMIRRQNRELVLDALRREGPLSRSQIATHTGLSNATLTAIGADMVAQGIVVELEERSDEAKGRGRPAVRVAHNRAAAYVLLIELDVYRCRVSLLDYGGVLVDRVESPITPTTFAQTAPHVFLIECIGTMIARNREIEGRLHNVSVSVQGILGPFGRGLKWSPIAHLAGNDLVAPVEAAYPLSMRLFKRGRLMADGVRWLHPELETRTVATLFVGATVGMGLTFPASRHPGADMGTEFGHMNHVPDGALCRCGARGCIEAYAADYGILRSAYSVPEHTPPASAVPPADFQQIIARARGEDRNAIHAFNIAGRALGFGLNRLMALVEIDRIVVLGPATAAYDLMRPGIEEGATASLMGRINGLPEITLMQDAGEPIYRGLMMKALTGIDRDMFAAMTAMPMLDSAE